MLLPALLPNHAPLPWQAAVDVLAERASFEVFAKGTTPALVVFASVYPAPPPLQTHGGLVEKAWSMVRNCVWLSFAPLEITSRAHGTSCK
jgi:hypothetical protein